MITLNGLIDKIQQVNNSLWEDIQKQTSDEGKIKRLKSWLKQDYPKTTKTPELDLLAREAALIAADNDISQAFALLNANHGIQKLTLSNLKPEHFAQGYFIVKQTNDDYQLKSYPAHWFLLEDAIVADLIVLHKGAAQERDKCANPNWQQNEAIETLDQCFQQKKDTVIDFIKKRTMRTAALMLDRKNSPMPVFERFWIAYERCFDLPSVQNQVIPTNELTVSPHMGLAPASLQELIQDLEKIAQAPINVEITSGESISHLIKTIREQTEAKETLASLITHQNDLKAFLAERKNTESAQGYTADPTSPANIVCAKIALSLIDTTAPNPREQFWNLLYPKHKQVFFGNTDADWPDYGHAILSEHGLIHYEKLALICQYQDVRNIIMPSLAEQKTNDAILMHAISEHPHYWKITQQTRHSIEHFVQDDQSRIFWNNHAHALYITDEDTGSTVEIKNYQEFFSELKKVLYKYREATLIAQKINPYDPKISTKRDMAMVPFREHLHNSNIMDRLAEHKKITTAAHGSITDINTIMSMRDRFSKEDQSCYDEGYTALNSTHNAPIQAWLQNTPIDMGTKIHWEKTETRGHDSRPLVQNDNDAFKSALQQVDDKKTLLDWVKHCADHNIQLPLNIVAEKFSQLVTNMRLVDIFNFIYLNMSTTVLFSDNSQRSFFYDEQGENIDEHFIQELFFGKLFSNGIQEHLLKTTEDYVYAFKLHTKYGVSGKSKTIQMAKDYIKTRKSFPDEKQLVYYLLNESDINGNDPIFDSLNHMSFGTERTFFLARFDLSHFKKACLLSLRFSKNLSESMIEEAVIPTIHQDILDVGSIEKHDSEKRVILYLETFIFEILIPSYHQHSIMNNERINLSHFFNSDDFMKTDTSERQAMLLVILTMRDFKTQSRKDALFSEKFGYWLNNTLSLTPEKHELLTFNTLFQNLLRLCENPPNPICDEVDQALADFAVEFNKMINDVTLLNKMLNKISNTFSHLILTSIALPDFNTLSFEQIGQLISHASIDNFQDTFPFFNPEYFSPHGATLTDWTQLFSHLYHQQVVTFLLLYPSVHRSLITLDDKDYLDILKTMPAKAVNGVFYSGPSKFSCGSELESMRAMFRVLNSAQCRQIADEADHDFSRSFNKTILSPTTLQSLINYVPIASDEEEIEKLKIIFTFASNALDFKTKNFKANLQLLLENLPADKQQQVIKALFSIHIIPYEHYQDLIMSLSDPQQDIAIGIIALDNQFITEVDFLSFFYKDFLNSILRKKLHQHLLNGTLSFIPNRLHKKYTWVQNIMMLFSGVTRDPGIEFSELSIFMISLLMKHPEEHRVTQPNESGSNFYFLGNMCAHCDHKTAVNFLNFMIKNRVDILKAHHDVCDIFNAFKNLNEPEQIEALTNAKAILSDFGLRDIHDVGDLLEKIDATSRQFVLDTLNAIPNKWASFITNPINLETALRLVEQHPAQKQIFIDVFLKSDFINNLARFKAIALCVMDDYPVINRSLYAEEYRRIEAIDIGNLQSCLNIVTYLSKPEVEGSLLKCCFEAAFMPDQVEREKITYMLCMKHNHFAKSQSTGRTLYAYKDMHLIREALFSDNSTLNATPKPGSRQEKVRNAVTWTREQELESMGKSLRPGGKF